MCVRYIIIIYIYFFLHITRIINLSIFVKKDQGNLILYIKKIQGEYINFLIF